MGQKKLQPKFLEGATLGTADRIEYQDAMSNLVRLVEYLRINEDLLTMQDYQAMMLTELERATPRKDILERVYGKFNKGRREMERLELGIIKEQT